MSFKGLFYREDFAGTLVCLGSGSLGTKIAKIVAYFPLSQKLKEPIYQGNFVGSLAPQKVNFYIGMELV